MSNFFEKYICLAIIFHNTGMEKRTIQNVTDSLNINDNSRSKYRSLY